MFQTEQCTIPLVQLASFMPPAAVPTFRWLQLPAFLFLTDPILSKSPPPHVLPCPQLWRFVQTAEDGPDGSASAVWPAVGLHVQLGPGRRHRRTGLWLAHWGSAQARGQSTHQQRALTHAWRAETNLGSLLCLLKWDCIFYFTYLFIFFILTSGQGKTQSEGANSGDCGGQTWPGTCLPWIPFQPLFNTRESPGFGWKATEAAPSSSGKLEGRLDTFLFYFRLNRPDLFLQKHIAVLSGCTFVEKAILL